MAGVLSIKLMAKRSSHDLLLCISSTNVRAYTCVVNQFTADEGRRALSTGTASERAIPLPPASPRPSAPRELACRSSLVQQRRPHPLGTHESVCLDSLAG
eukprot:scaffold104822_cov35-Tisochrysis_lutea.AAC.1